MPEDLIDRGVQAAQTGDHPLAQELLFQAVRQSPRSARAWFWLGQVLTDPAKKQYCLDAAAKLDPVVVDQEQTALLMALAEAEFSRAEPVRAEPPAPPVEAQAPRAGRERPEPAAPLPVELPSQPPAKAGRQGIVIPLVGLGLLAVLLLAAALLGGGSFGAPARTLTPDLAATETYERLGFQVTAAREALDDGHSQPCIDQYDALLEEMPNWAIGYYNRGVCKRMAKKNQTVLSVYEELHRSAIEDQDMAIRIDPEYDHAYIERAFDYMNLVNSAENRADEDLFNSIALENLLQARSLDSDRTSLGRNIAYVLMTLDRCEESLEEAYRLIDTTPTGEERAELYDIVAQGHNCLGEYEKAMPYIEKSVEYDLTRSRVQLYASSLIGAGKMRTAFQLLDKDLECCPEFNGYRYYLRAVIYLDQGNYGLAADDAYTGAGYTWYRRGLYAYLMGKLALEDGDKQAAGEWFQIAAGSVMPHEGLWVEERIHAELDNLGVKYKPPKPTLRMKVTPIPPYKGSADTR